MRTDLSEIEHHSLFLNPIRNLKFEIDELNKMLEARIELLTKHFCEGEICGSHKTIKSETVKALEGASTLCQKAYKGLIETLEKSFHKIEGVNEESE